MGPGLGRQWLMSPPLYLSLIGLIMSSNSNVYISNEWNEMEYTCFSYVWVFDPFHG